MGQGVWIDGGFKLESGEMFVSGIFCVLPSFCVLSGCMKVHLYKSFAAISLGHLIFRWRCRDIYFASHHIWPVCRCS